MIRWAAINTMTSRIAQANPPHGSNAGTGPANHDRFSTTLQEDAGLAQRKPLTKIYFT
jgi:hypothetical protein